MLGYIIGVWVGTLIVIVATGDRTAPMMWGWAVGNTVAAVLAQYWR